MRFLVMRRDDFKCGICGSSPAMKPGTLLVVDHIDPLVNGGETVMENLQTLCEPCNGGKTSIARTRSSKGRLLESLVPGKAPVLHLPELVFFDAAFASCYNRGCVENRTIIDLRAKKIVVTARWTCLGCVTRRAFAEKGTRSA